VEGGELLIARITWLEQRHALRQATHGELAHERREAIRSEWMAVTESVARQALAHDYGDAVHDDTHSLAARPRRGGQA